MDDFFLVIISILVGSILIWTIISGILSISRAWKLCVAERSSSKFISHIFSTISGSWMGIFGIIILCMPVWLILSIAVSGKGKKPPILQERDLQKQSMQGTELQDTNLREEVSEDNIRKTQRINMPLKVTIGRNQSCDITVDDKYEDVSRTHAVLSYENSFLMIEDKSTNGSFINGQKLHQAKRRIQQGDIITIGRNYTLLWQDINRFFPNDFVPERKTERWNK
ncbi:MAG: FHA domain-containing protein [Bacteroidales bacterium]|jgi:hypothetical protein|nr:FHA domain-containing protein [Bacteroidales bacterium]